MNKRNQPLFYHLGENNKLYGPNSLECYIEWHNAGYFPQSSIIYDSMKMPYNIETLIRVNKRDGSDYAESFCTENDRNVGNITVADVTIHLNNSIRKNETYYTNDFNQSTRILESISEDYDKNPTQDKFLMLVNNYIDRRPLSNCKTRVIDSYLPFEEGWPHWVDMPLTAPEAIQLCVDLYKQLNHLKAETVSRYFKSLKIPIRNCSLCKISNCNEIQMFQHVLTLDHLNNIYSNSGHTLSWIDVYCAQKMCKDIQKVENGEIFLSNTKSNFAREVFFETADQKESFASLNSYLYIRKEIPLMATLKGRDIDDRCEYVEAMVYFRKLEVVKNEIPKKIFRRHIGNVTMNICQVCNFSTGHSSLESFMLHILSKNHVNMALEKGVSRSDLAYWITFCESLTRSKNPINLYNSKSLQEWDFPICKRDDSPNQYSGGDIKRIRVFLQEAVRKMFLSSFTDFIFHSRCEQCNVNILTRSHAFKHIIYDEYHFEQIRSISNCEVRDFLDLAKINITVPLFGRPGKDGENSEVVFTESRRKMYINKLCRLIERTKPQKIFAAKLDISFVNFCEICNTEICNIDEVLPHLMLEEHWRLMKRNHRFLEKDFEFWWNILIRNYGNPI